MCDQGCHPGLGALRSGAVSGLIWSPQQRGLLGISQKQDRVTNVPEGLERQAGVQCPGGGRWGPSLKTQTAWHSC